MEKVNKGKQRRSASTAASNGPGPSAAVPSVSGPSAAVPAVNDPAASAAHVDSNSSPSPRSSPSPPPPSEKAPPPAAPVQHQQQQQQQHKQRQGVKGSQTGRRQRAPAVSFDESVERFWAAVFKGHPQGSGGRTRRLGIWNTLNTAMALTIPNIPTQMDSYRSPRCTLFALRPRTTWGCSYPGNPEGETLRPLQGCD